VCTNLQLVVNSDRRVPLEMNGLTSEHEGSNETRPYLVIPQDALIDGVIEGLARLGNWVIDDVGTLGQ
jgi:hypothetical protein